MLFDVGHKHIWQFECIRSRESSILKAKTIIWRALLCLIEHSRPSCSLWHMLEQLRSISSQSQTEYYIVRFAVFNAIWRITGMACTDFYFFHQINSFRTYWDITRMIDLIFLPHHHEVGVRVYQILIEFCQSSSNTIIIIVVELEHFGVMISENENKNIPSCAAACSLI